MKIAMRDFFDELFEDYDDFILQDFTEGKDNITVCFLFNQRKLRLFIVNYDSPYEREFFAEEQVEESFSYPHAFNRDENGWISYCLLEKEDFVLTSLSLENYLRLYISQLYELLTLSSRQIDLEYQKEFLIYWENEAYRTSQGHQIKDFTIYSTLGEVAKEVSYFRKEENDSESGYIADANEDVNDWYCQSKYQVEKALYIPITDTQGIRPPTLSLQWDRSTLLAILSNPYVDHISSQSHIFLSKLKCNSYRKIIVLKMTPPQMEPIVFSFIIAFKNNDKKSFLEKLTEDFEKIILLECKSFSIEHLVARTATAASFKEKNVLLIGGGSVGGYLALQLSKLGIRKLTISDTKNLNYETVLRNYIGAGSIFSQGNKARLLKSKIELDAPWLHIDAWNWNILAKDREEQQRLLSDFDLIIVATGGSDTQRRFNAAFHEIGLSCPVIFDWLDSEGKGIHAVVMHCKNKGCFECLFTEDGKTLGNNKVSFADGTEKIHRNGCNGSFTTYGNDVLSRNISMMLPLIQRTLLNGVEENYLVSISNDFSSLETALTVNPTIEKAFASEGCVICGRIPKLEQIEKV